MRLLPSAARRAAADRPGSSGTGRRLVRYFAVDRWLVALLAGLTMLVVALGMVSPLVLQRMLNVALPRRDARELIVLGTTMFLATALANVAAVAQNYLSNTIAQRVVGRMREDVYATLQRQPLAFFGRTPTSDIQARLVSDIGGLSDIVSFSGQSFISSVSSLCVGMTVMLALSWPIALASVTLAMVLNLLNLRLIRKRRALAKERQESVDVMMRHVGEDMSFSGITLGRTLGVWRKQLSRFEEASRRSGTLTRDLRLVGGSSQAMVGMIFALVPPLIFVLSGTLLTGLSLGTVVVLTTMQSRVSGPIGQLLGMSGSLQSAKVMADRVFAYVDMERQVELVDADPMDAAVESLTLTGVSHSFGGEERLVLQDVTLTLTGNAPTFIVGTTGSGKSTLAQVIAGLVEPRDGHVLLNHHREPARGASLWQAVTLVPQESVLFNGTLRENLLIGNAAADQPTIQGALETSALLDTIGRLTDGLDSIVGERGYRLSGGERQRVAIARALIADSGVLVLDEATSALDDETAHIVLERLRAARRGRPLIVISHDRSLMRPGDTLVTVEGGRVTALEPSTA